MSNTEKHPAIALADWADWFCSNVKESTDFHWIHMAEMANQLRELYKQLDSQQHVMDTRLNQIIELENERDELLEALQEIVAAADGEGWDQIDADFIKARAAIAKATGETK